MQLQTDYLDTEADTMRFLVYGTNPFIPIDSLNWIKVKDYASKTNARSLHYIIHSKNKNPELRNFSIEPNTLKTTSYQNQFYLTFYRSFLMVNDTLNKMYYETDPMGKYIRFFNSSFVQLKSRYYNGPAIWTYLDFKDKLNDSSERQTNIEEYYAYKKGLVKSVKSVYYYSKGTMIADSVFYSYRIQ